MIQSKPIQILISLWRDVTAKRVINAASMLTYSTLLAIVPVAAVIFAIARGFGYNKYIESWFRTTLEGHEKVVDVIIGFVNSYLVHTQSGVVFGIGLVFMLYTVLMLTRNIEQVFNDIWNVHHQRDFFRSVTDYLAMFFLLPIIIILMTGLTLWASSFSKVVKEAFVIGSMLNFTISVAPFVLLFLFITLLYVFMPNTRVKWRNALLPAFFASIVLELLQYFYVHSQIWVSSYNAIYGSFAALPLFMLWLQLTWTIILIGAELSYTEQNIDEFNNNYSLTISIRYRYMLTAILMSRICRRFNEGKHPYTVDELKEETHLPMRIINELIFDLTKAGLIIEATTNSSGLLKDKAIVPAESVENITVGKLLSRIESLHPWVSEHDPDIVHHINSDKWRKVFSNRDKYLRAQDEIKLYELDDKH